MFRTDVCAKFRMNSIRTCLLVLVLFSTSLAGKLRAELPEVPAEQLADLVQQQENRIQTFQVKYKLTHGDYSEMGELVPNMIIDCEYAHDIGKGHKYLHQKQVSRSSGQELEMKYAYDGKRGTKLWLKQPGDPGRMYGRIMPNPPEDLVDQAVWKPDVWSAYGFIEESDTLSSAIRNAKRIEVTTEESDGEELYRVTFAATGGEKKKIVLPDGREHWVDMGRTYAAWLSPHKGFRPVKIARLRGPGGDITSTCNASDFREISPGTWLPYRLERSSVGRRRGRIIEVDTIVINEKASVVSRLEFPPGTYMKNEKWGIEYQAGRGLSAVRLETVTKTLMVYLVFGVLLMLGILILLCYKHGIRKKNSL